MRQVNDSTRNPGAGAERLGRLAFVAAVTFIACNLEASQGHESEVTANLVQDPMSSTANETNVDDLRRHVAVVCSPDHIGSCKDLCAGVFVSKDQILTAKSCLRRLQTVDAMRYFYVYAVADDSLFFLIDTEDDQAIVEAEHELKNNVAIRPEDGSLPADIALAKLLSTELGHPSEADISDLDLIATISEAGVTEPLSYPYYVQPINTFRLTEEERWTGSTMRISFSFEPVQLAAASLFGYDDEEFHTLLWTSPAHLCSNAAGFGNRHIEHGMPGFLARDNKLAGIYSRNLDWYRGPTSCDTREGNLFANVGKQPITDWIQEHISK